MDSKQKNWAWRKDQGRRKEYGESGEPERGHWYRIGKSRALDVQGKMEYLGSMAASWTFIYIVYYILDHNSLHRQKQIFTELWNSYPEAVGLNV